MVILVVHALVMLAADNAVLIVIEIEVHAVERHESIVVLW
jgi:hypothetical protein